MPGALSYLIPWFSLHFVDEEIDTKVLRNLLKTIQLIIYDAIAIEAQAI